MRKVKFLNILLLMSMLLAACATSVPSAPTDAPEVEPVVAATTAPAEVEPTAVPEEPDTDDPVEEVTAPVATKYQEAPMLAARVAAGELPPVDERLPENPVVIEPFNEIGEYGGRLRFGFQGTHAGWGGLWYINGWDNLVIWAGDFSGIEPNIAERWEVSPDATEYTFYLRRGIKWSDGEPFTADDVIFYVEDVLFNEDLSPAGPGADWLNWMEPEVRREFQATKINDYTFKFTFPLPYGTFLLDIATWAGRSITFYPSHWLKQFHRDYNPDVDALAAAEEGVEDWIGLFNKMVAGPPDYWDLPQRPLLYPYVITQPMGTGTQVLMERNPYYWKVDTEGNQLPYIDEVLGISFQDFQNRTFAMLNGDLDALKDPGGDNRILYFEAMEEGRPIYINFVQGDGANTNSIHFNRTYGDPVKAEIFANKDFRIGMSHAINRAEIIDIVHHGQGTPAQVAPLPSSPLYNERLATQYIAYDVDLANEYLDRVLPNKDSQGFRLDETGKRLSIVMTVSSDLSYGTTWVQLGELLVEYWKDVGVEVVLNAIPDSQFIEYKNNNELEASIYTGEGGAGLNAILDPRYFVPASYFSIYGIGWYNWWTGDADLVSVEPPQWVKDYRAKFQTEVLQANTQEGQVAAMQDILEMAADEFWVIGISWGGLGYQPWSSAVKNLPEVWVGGWIPGVHKIMYPEQWYLSD